MEAIVRNDFTANSDDELSLKKNEVIRIVNMDVPGWYLAGNDDGQGYVPAHYVQMKPHEWYSGKMSRQQAEVKLMADHGGDGAFLIRESESAPGDFMLSVRFDGGVKHFKVLRDGAGKYFLWVVKFNSLNALVDYHRTSSVNREQQILLKDRTITTTKALVLYNFDAQDDDELSARQNEIVEIIDQTDPNWWKASVERNGTKHTGKIPSNYVNLLDHMIVATVLFDFDAQEADELSVRRNDVVEITDKTDANWWKASVNKNGTIKTGTIPSNYLKIHKIGTTGNA